jgi:hypothetical protein
MAMVSVGIVFLLEGAIEVLISPSAFPGESHSSVMDWAAAAHRRCSLSEGAVLEA